MSLTEKHLIKERAHPGGVGGVQRLYRLPNGYGLSLVNSPELHAYSFAWEAAVVSKMDEEGNFEELVYDTPLTSDVEVFNDDAEANAFINKAVEWADGHESAA